MKKKVGVRVAIIIGIIIVLILGICGAFLFITGGGVMSEDVAFPVPISEIYGMDISFSSNRYNAVVELKEVVSIKADSDKVIKENFVEAGDTVKKGDKLFEYDIDQLQLQLSQSQLDLDQANAEINMCNSQITSLQQSKSSANQNEKLNIDNQILSLQLQIKGAEYTVSSKTTEIDELNDLIENNVVTSDVNGKVQSISDPDDQFMGSEYMKIATDEDFKIKAMVSEVNIETFYKDAPVIVRSRLDETKTWTGKVTSVDTSNPVKSTDMYGSESDTKYPVYIELDSTTDLMVGQHVTVELDVEKSTSDDVLLLDDVYICDVDTAPYVWWMNPETTLLEKRPVELGNYIEEEYKYEILSGLTVQDSIAYPQDYYTEGMQTITYYDLMAESEAMDDAGIPEVF